MNEEIMEIQKTTISDMADGAVRVEMQISKQKDVEPSSDYAVFSVFISTEVKHPQHDPVEFRLLQKRALKEAIDLLGRVDDKIC